MQWDFWPEVIFIRFADFAQRDWLRRYYRGRDSHLLFSSRRAAMTSRSSSAFRLQGLFIHHCIVTVLRLCHSFSSSISLFMHGLMHIAGWNHQFCELVVWLLCNFRPMGVQICQETKLRSHFPRLMQWALQWRNAWFQIHPWASPIITCGQFCCISCQSGPGFMQCNQTICTCNSFVISNKFQLNQC